MQQQLLLLQLKKGGAPIAWSRIFEAMDLNDPQRIIDESFEEQERLEKLKVLAQLDIMKTLKALGIDPQQLQGGEANSGKPHPGGRPSTDAKPPKVKQKGAKGGDPRSTVTTS
jgi:hypothetical protein